MKARLRPTHVIDHDLLEKALGAAEAVGREKDRDRRTALEQEAIRLWNELTGATLREPKYPNVKIKLVGLPADKLVIVDRTTLALH